MKKNTLKIALAILAIVILASCSSPVGSGKGGGVTGGGSTGGEGAIRLSFAADSRTLVDTATELANMVHTVTCTGPGGTVTEEFSGTSGTIMLAAGRWTISVRATGDRPAAYVSSSSPPPTGVAGFPARMLRAMSDDVVVEVTPGNTSTVPVQMIPATEASNSYQLALASDMVNDNGKEEILLVSADLDFSSVGYTNAGFKPTQNIRIMADKPVRLHSVTGLGPMITVLGKLTLGWPGMKGSLILDLNLSSFNKPIIWVGDASNSGEFIMYNGVTLTGNNFPGNGGGVFVENGTFTMNGGEISGNTAGATSNGGGVFVAPDGIFNMNGGEIKSNKSSSNGGGVYVMLGGTMVKNGGTIYGPPSDLMNQVTSGGFPGHAVFVNLITLYTWRNSTVGPNERFSVASGVVTGGGPWDDL